MLSWYIDSSRTESKYIEVVNRNVQPCMDYFCLRLSEMEYYNDIDILKVYDQHLMGKVSYKKLIKYLETTE